jgi:hypothetical protein
MDRAPTAHQVDNERVPDAGRHAFVFEELNLNVPRNRSLTTTQ